MRKAFCGRCLRHDKSGNCRGIKHAQTDRDVSIALFALLLGQLVCIVIEAACVKLAPTSHSLRSIRKVYVGVKIGDISGPRWGKTACAPVHVSIMFFAMIDAPFPRGRVTQTISYQYLHNCILDASTRIQMQARYRKRTKDHVRFAVLLRRICADQRSKMILCDILLISAALVSHWRERETGRTA